VTVTSLHPDFAAVKAKQQKTWSSGDFAVVASRIVLAAERLAEAADLRAGWDVLDVASGNGNATIAAARHGVQAVGIDYVPALLDRGRHRAAAELLDVEFVVGDAEDLPFDDDSFDAVLSIYGTMFAPNHQQTTDEIVRVARPGATVALGSWTPDGFIGEMFGVITSYVPAPPGLASPMLWGTENHLAELFGASLADIRSSEEVQPFRFATPREFVAFFRRWYGPTFAAFNALDDGGREALSNDLADLASRYDKNADGGSICIPATYLESVITLK
jgi:ubiquinone/menaquinone biosynthesis C-methylase UbiE